MNSVSAQLRDIATRTTYTNDRLALVAIADQLDGGNAGSGSAPAGRVLALTGPDYPTWGPDQRAVADYWVHGRIGCMAGGRQSDYSIVTTEQQLLGDIPRHLFIVVSPELAQPGMTGFGCVASAADAGWMNGAAYVYDHGQPGHVNYERWEAAGRPSKDAQGRPYSPQGIPFDPSGQQFSPV